MFATGRARSEAPMCAPDSFPSRSSIPLEVGHDLLQLVVDVFGVQLSLAGGAGQGLDERYPGGQVPAGDEGPPGHRGPVAYRGDLGQFLVVGLAEDPLLELIQPLVQPEGRAGR
jgi:hypothetical protein